MCGGIAICARLGELATQIVHRAPHRRAVLGVRIAKQRGRDNRPSQRHLAARAAVNCAGPGFTATDLDDFRGTRNVEQVAREPVRLAPAR